MENRSEKEIHLDFLYDTKYKHLKIIEEASLKLERMQLNPKAKNYLMNDLKLKISNAEGLVNDVNEEIEYYEKNQN